MNGSRFYWFETAFRTMRDAMRGYLKSAGIYYELSGGAGLWHFEIEIESPEQLEAVNAFIDSQSITEEKPSDKRTA